MLQRPRLHPHRRPRAHRRRRYLPACPYQRVSAVGGLSATLPIADVRAALIDAGISAVIADAWVAEVGSPATFAFELEFDAISFIHRQGVNGGRMEVDEDGRFELVGDRLRLIVGDHGSPRHPSPACRAYRGHASASVALLDRQRTSQGQGDTPPLHDRVLLLGQQFVRQ